MKHSVNHVLGACAGLATVLFLQLFHTGTQTQGYSIERYSTWTASVGSPVALETIYEQSYPDSLEYRIARRLQRRLRRSSRISPPIDSLAEAIVQRQGLLKKRTTITFTMDEEEAVGSWDISTSKYPTWIRPYFSLSGAQYQVSPIEIQKFLKKNKVVDSIEPVHVTMSGTFVGKSRDAPLRAEINGVAKDGYIVDIPETIATIMLAFHEDEEEVTVPLKNVPGRIINRTGKDLGDLKLLATGRSNFRGSTNARSWNVRKALNEHVNNVLVAPGEEYSFNGTLEGPVSLGNGWTMAKIIINGEELVDAPGGGICQASTTVYRAIINAGLPVTERRAHSLYVSYYREHGIGIDATIYPGSQDLMFKNDTGEYILIQSYNDGYDAYVKFYGTDDGRKVALEGPLFAHNSPDDFEYRGRNLSIKEIAWIQRVTYADGRTERNVILSRYKQLPESLSWEFALAD